MIPRTTMAAMAILWPGLALGQFADATKSGDVTVPKDAKAIKLDGTIDDVVVGGAGRYLLAVQRELKQVAIFDAKEGRVVHSLPLGNESSLVAAGSDKLVVVDPDKATIERYSLSTYAKEKKATLPGRGVVLGAVMGSGSKGPLLLHAAVGTKSSDKAGYFFIDTGSMKVIPIASGQKARFGDSFRDIVHLRASTNGAVFSQWQTNPGFGMETFVANTKQIRVYSETQGVGHVLPGPDGKVIYTGHGGMFTSDLKPVRTSVASARRNEKVAEMYLPAQSTPDFYLGIQGLEDKPGRVVFRRTTRGQIQSTVTRGERANPIAYIYKKGAADPAATVDDLDEMVGEYGSESRTKDDFTLDKRFHLIPDAGILVTVPPSNNMLVVRKVELPSTR